MLPAVLREDDGQRLVITIDEGGGTNVGREAAAYNRLVACHAAHAAKSPRVTAEIGRRHGTIDQDHEGTTPAIVGACVLAGDTVRLAAQEPLHGIEAVIVLNLRLDVQPIETCKLRRSVIRHGVPVYVLV